MRNPIVSDNLKIIVESIDLIEERFSKINLANEDHDRLTVEF